MAITTTNSGAIAHFKQGVEIVTLGDFFSGLLPKIGSGLRTKLVRGLTAPTLPNAFDDSLLMAAGSSGSIASMPNSDDRVQMFPNHVLETSDFGYSKGYFDDTPFLDVVSTKDAASLIRDEADELLYPDYIIDIGERHEYNGIIEPLEIRAVSSLSAIEGQDVAHKVRGFITSFAEDSRGQAVKIFDFIDLETTQTEPFQDSVESFGDVTTPGTASFKLFVNPGFMSNFESTINPFVESSDAELIGEDLLDDVAMRAIIVAMTGSTTGSIELDDFRPRHHKSSVCGFRYVNNVEGSDSIAFGGLKK